MDSSAVLALAFAEPGSESLAPMLGDSAISAVNATEVMTRFVDRGEDPATAKDTFLAFGLDVVPFDLAQSASAAALRPATRSSGLSLGDRACLALAGLRGARAVTADRAWGDLDIGVEIEVIR